MRFQQPGVLAALSLLAFLAVSWSATPQYMLFKIKDFSGGAMCLDGSFPSLYWKPGTNKGKYMIFFEGGGWCGGLTLAATIKDCYQRSLNDLGSSRKYPLTITPSGLLSVDPDLNPIYYDYSVIYLKYCDGTGHQGYNPDPVLYNDTQIWFRGENNTRFLIQYGMDSLGLKDATEVAVFGSSAGALATYYWIDEIRRMFNSSTYVYGIPDSGIFLDMETYSGHSHDYRTLIYNFMTLSNKYAPPILKQCALDNPEETWKCMMFQYIYKYVKTPMFIIQSQYDLWSIQNILKMSCANAGTLTACSDSEVKYIESFKSQMVSNINSYLSLQKESGAWSVACINHGYCVSKRCNSQNYQIPQNSGNTVVESISEWIVGFQQAFIDKVNWPNNAPCAAGQPS